ncbi:SIMPL domain-containing protein [Actibacterium sp. MT2.3-13A]|uniref:SIMPL domain-containing protein n=1 Tax=Actibacterium sp. MT2.3-13A TaxID=2828332 RepID=UPI001BA637C4|nr:SIMPL domain-containing protein [Actibacterium sp. MT2.3-13A]
MRFLSIILVVLGLATAAKAAENGPSITVTGHGEVAAAPDMATITLGVTRQAKTAAAAMDETSAATAEVLKALEAAGVAARDMQTSELSLDPVWEDVGGDGRAPRIVGFAARNTLRVRVRDLNRLGAVLDDVLRVGANTFQGLSFGLREPEPLADQALAAAAADARRKAALIAGAAGVALGPVLSISEAGGVAPVPMMLEAARAAIPVAAGEVSQTATVTMVFALGG